jgi:hypothetical protein
MKTVAPVLLLDNKFATLWYHPDTKIVHHQFHKFVYGEAFREVLNAGAEAMKKYRAEKWLSDDRQNSALKQKDLDWANTDWLPRVQAAGWKFWAIVQPENVLGRLNMQKAAQLPTGNGVMTRMFGDPDEAMAWLVGQ